MSHSGSNPRRQTSTTQVTIPDVNMLENSSNIAVSLPINLSINVRLGAKGDWEFRISDLVKNPDGTDI